MRVAALNACGIRVFPITRVRVIDHLARFKSWRNSRRPRYTTDTVGTVEDAPATREPAIRSDRALPRWR